MGRENTWKFLTESEYTLGEYQWIAFEHRGETYWPRLCSQAGAIDLFLQKKDAFYQNVSHWTDAPMVHLMPHWNWCGMEGEEILVAAYTNCSELELFLNGESLGKKEIEQYGHGEWNVPFAKGELKCVAYKDGKIVAEDVRKTSGKSYALKLKLENDNAVKAGDIALFTCYVVDEEGNVVPDAYPFVRFFTNAKGVIVGTGSDVCDHNPVNLPVRQMRMGAISIAVKLTGAEGELKLYAESDGLNRTMITM
jgi:beta-galactosidase